MPDDGVQGNLLCELAARGGPSPLPPVWDGRTVQWSSWEMPPPMFICPPPKAPPCCPACGSQRERAMCHGVVAPLPGELFDSLKTVRLRSGRCYDKPVKVAAWPVLRLLAHRCPDCHHDEIFDMRLLRQA